MRSLTRNSRLTQEAIGRTVAEDDTWLAAFRRVNVRRGKGDYDNATQRTILSELCDANGKPRPLWHRVRREQIRRLLYLLLSKRTVHRTRNHCASHDRQVRRSHGADEHNARRASKSPDDRDTPHSQAMACLTDPFELSSGSNQLTDSLELSSAWPPANAFS